MPTKTALDSLQGLEDLTEVGRGHFGVVYRARRDGRQYAVKVLQSGLTLTEGNQPIAFYREAGVLSRVRDDGICRIWHVGVLEGQPYLVMDYLGGGSLARRLTSGPLPAPELTRIARVLARALDTVHRAGIVHRDVKPENIMFDEGANPKLVDFGLAGGAALKDYGAAGTLRYSAPELALGTGQVDGRADLYSLGVVLFECATGQAPFTSVDPAQLVREHATAPVPDITQLNPGFPQPLAAVIQRLLSKDPELRHPTGAALVRDLAQLTAPAAEAARSTEQNEAGSETEVRQGDLPLVGREVELNRLIGALNGARSGRGSFAVIEGPPGAGKTRLVRELVSIGQQRGMTLLEAKCAADEARPYSPLRTALEGLVSPRRMRQLSEEAREQLVQNIITAAADYGPMLRAFAPMLSSVLPGGQGFSGAQEQFVEVLAAFLSQLSERLGGLLVFLDDIHNLDDASAEVLARVAKRAPQVPMFVVATSRNNAESQAKLQSYTKNNQVTFSHDIRLSPLSSSAVERLIASYLGNNQVGAEVAQLVVTRSEGNPFAVRELLQALLDHGLLRLSWGTFTLDQTGLERLSLPSDLLDLVVRRIDQLGGRTLELLTTASFMGASFDASLLAATLGSHLETVSMALEEALHANLIERRSATEYAFVHDRIREALQKVTTPEKAADIHQQIAETLATLAGASEDPATLFAKAAHYMAGVPTRTPERALSSAVAAGRGSLDAFADQKAYDFLTWALRFARTSNQEVPAAVHTGLASVCMRTGRLPEAKEAYSALLATSKDPLVLGRARAELVRIAGYEELRKEQLQDFALAFGELGELMPGNQFKPWVMTLKDWGALALSSFEKASAGSLQPDERERLETLISMYDWAYFLGFFVSDDAVLVQSTVRPLRLALKLGPSRPLVRALGAYAVLLALLKNNKASSRYADLAEQFARQIGDPLAVANASRQKVLSLMLQGSEPRRTAQLAAEVLAKHQSWFDAWEFENLCTVHDMIALPRGHARDVLKWSAAAIERLEQNALTRRDVMVISFSRAQQACALALLGRRADSLQQLALVDDMLANRQNLPRYHRTFITTDVAMARIWLGELPLAEQLLVGQAAALPLVKKTPPLFDYYFAMALLRLEQVLEAEVGNAPVDTRPLEVAVAELRKRAPWRQFQPHALVFEGASLRLKGALEPAKRVLARAESMAMEDDVPWAISELNRQRALLYRSVGDSVCALRCARAAVAVAREQGLERLASMVLGSFPGAEMAGGNQAHVLASTFFSEGGAKLRSGARKKLDALLQVSLATTETIDPKEQSHRALAELIRVLDAERAFLFLEPEVGGLGGALKEGIGRDAKGNVLGSLTGYATTIVEKVRTSRNALIVSGTEAGEVLGSQSAVAHGLKSIMAAPLAVRDRFIGVVYLDTHVAHGTFGSEELELLTAIANHIALAFEMARAARAQVEGERIRHELAVTSTVQAMLLPKVAATHDRVSVACRYQPATVSGGDWWYQEQLSSGATRVYLGDVTGHGVGAAMVTAALASAFHASRRHEPQMPVTELLRWIHWSLRDVTQGAYCATFMAAEIDPGINTLRWWSAGAPPALMSGAAGSVTTLNRVASTPLGGGTDIVIDAGSAPFAPGNLLVLFSDGAPELRAASGRPFGIKGMAKLIQQLPAGVTAEEACEFIMTSLRKAQRDAPADDDITLLAVRLAGGPPRELP